MTDPIHNRMNSQPERPSMPPVHIVLVKGEHRFTFRCGPGEEGDLLVELANLVRDRDMQFSWLDAAVIAHALGRHLGRFRGRLTVSM